MTDRQIEGCAFVIAAVLGCLAMAALMALLGGG